MHQSGDTNAQYGPRWGNVKFGGSLDSMNITAQSLANFHAKKVFVST